MNPARMTVPPTTDQINQRLGEVIANARHERDWSQEDLAERLGVNQTTVSRWEKGERSISVAQAVMLTRVLGLTDAVAAIMEEVLSGVRDHDGARG